jgi:hypothetical protein
LFVDIGVPAKSRSYFGKPFKQGIKRIIKTVPQPVIPMQNMHEMASGAFNAGLKIPNTANIF